LGIDGNWKYSGAAGTTASFDSDRLSAGQPAGIAYFRNRTYDMNTGRWMQEDPIGIAGGDNLYQFNGNNPVTFTDPFGLRPECCEEALPAVAEAALAIGAPPAALVIGLVAVGVAVAGNQNDHVVITTSIQAPADATAVHSRTNKVQPHPDAEGAHTGYKTDGGKVTGYTEFDADGNPRKRFRGTGRPHGGQEPPLILEPEPGKGPGSPPKVPRAPRPEELPRGY
jgi:RHS repeat-associated protein